MNRVRLILAGILGAGVLMAGIGTGIALKEYSSLEYSGEHIIGEVDMQKKKGEVNFKKAGEGDIFKIYCGCSSDNVEVVEDAQVPENIVRYEVDYNRKQVEIALHGESDDGFFSIVGQWKDYSDSTFQQMMECKDDILKELKQNRIGNYRVKGIEKVKLSVNPKTLERLEVH